MALARSWGWIPICSSGKVLSIAQNAARRSKTFLASFGASGCASGPLLWRGGRRAADAWRCMVVSPTTGALNGGYLVQPATYFRQFRQLGGRSHHGRPDLAI